MKKNDEWLFSRALTLKITHRANCSRPFIKKLYFGAPKYIEQSPDTADSFLAEEIACILYVRLRFQCPVYTISISLYHP